MSEQRENQPQPKRKAKVILIGAVVLGSWLLFVWFLYWAIFAPIPPDTEKARVGFREITRLDLADVSNVYYDRPYDFNDATTEILRFNYLNEKWLEKFLSRLGLSRTEERRDYSYRVSSDSSYRVPWWDSVLISRMPERYWEGSPQRGTRAWVDRDLQLVLLVKYR